MPAPDFTLMDLTGNKYSLADFRGKVILLYFGQIWSDDWSKVIACSHEINNPDVVFISVILHTDAETLKQKIKGRKKAGIYLISDGQIEKEYSVNEESGFFILSKEGKILNNIADLGGPDYMADELKKALK